MIVQLFVLYLVSLSTPLNIKNTHNKIASNIFEYVELSQ